MRVVKARSALLSDFEVLQLLRETEEAQRERANERRHQASRREGFGEEDDGTHGVPPNVRTIQFEVISSLSQRARPCAHQTAAQIRGFLEALEKKGYAGPDARILAGEPGLTKAERLQLVNHAPTSVVDLHTVRADHYEDTYLTYLQLVEELGQRLSEEQIQDVLECVSTHFPVPDRDVLHLEPAEYEDVSMATAEQNNSFAAEEPEEQAAVEEHDAFPEEHFEYDSGRVDDDMGDDND